MKEINRREFLKTLGASAAAATGATTLVGCMPNQDGSVDAIDPAGTETSPIPTDKMEYRSFESLDNDKVSLLGYGCMRWPMIPNPNGEGEIVDQEQVNALVDYAIEHGVNYFDTAPVYLQGQSEAAMGIALSRYPRDKYYIATKLSNMSNPDIEFSKNMYYSSFKNLKVDYIDYLLMHTVGMGGMETFSRRFIENGMMDFLVKEREAGRIRHLGWSFHGDVAVFDFLLKLHDEGKYHWDFVQIQHNYIDWKLAKGFNTPAEYLYGELAKRNIPVVVMEPLLGGRLSKLPDHIVARLKQREPEKSAASWAFRYAGTMPQILSVLSGMTYMEHLQDNLRSFAPFKPLSEDEINFLYETAGLINQYETVPCNDCKYCMPCPYGVDIPAILLHYNKCVNQGNIAESTQDPDYRRLRQVYLVGYDRSVPKLRQADHCIGCKTCNPHCPQSINIPQQLQKINDYVESLKQDTLGQVKEA